MPLRKHTKPPPRFTFVTPEFEGSQMRWLKTHSDATRSHAAYWSGPARRRWQASKESNRKEKNVSVEATRADEHTYLHTDKVEFRHSSAEVLQCYDSTTLVDITNLPSAGHYSIPRQVEPPNSQCPPTLTPHSKAIRSFSVDLTVLKFYDEDFMRKFVMVEDEDSTLMLTSCLLLGYAHRMALTGRGTRMTLLELKSQVISHLAAKMDTSDELLSPRCLIAILTLGAPIVCLMSRDLPKGLSIREDVHMMLDEDYLCNEEAALMPRTSLNEQVVHRQALRRLFFKTKAQFQDVESIALLHYISNYINMCVPVNPSIHWLSFNKIVRTNAVEATSHLYSSPSEIEQQFPVTDLCQGCAVSAHWTSPFSCEWVETTPAADIESQMLLLAGLVHKWLATFFDGNHAVLALTDELLQKRINFRKAIENFAPATMNSNVKEEAMYECCRHVTSVLLASERQRISIHIAAKHLQLRPKITKLFPQTDLTNLWGRHRGLLFWVAVTYQCATASQCFPFLCTALLARLSQELSMSRICAEITVKSLKRLKFFESLCCYQYCLPSFS
ncbi:hypothetical protein V8C35DRAFT_327860 [Trichoderma chlorosporum]